LAEKQYADATKSSGYDVATALEYVEFLRRRGSIGRAEDVLIELASRWPSNVGILVALANVKLEQQNWAGAQDVAEKIRQSRKSDTMVVRIRFHLANGDEHRLDRRTTIPKHTCATLEADIGIRAAGQNPSHS